ncbi:SubName: Full=Related to dimethylaniline monooxygenase {ECO:0000313/EMBL:CCA70769.1} [Serendipita indica DSM 11827]|nr:SubName: Full=Related to dimethylaniline monooxygenase {ECO:0000313/EMBL:CCA70769.1} [Serendipita indica DSM 11827]
MTEETRPRVVIVGAGWSGITLAKTYLQLDSETPITLLEAERTLGGVWSADRAYPELQTQVPYGRYESWDLPMSRTDGVKPERADFIPSCRMHDYLVELAQKFNVMDKIRFNISVTHIERHENGVQWKLRVTDTSKGAEEEIICDKLVIATGVHSLHKIPDIPSENFTPLTIHSRFVGQHYHDLHSPDIEVVTVYGGGKSAYDVVQAASNAEKDVHWVIRTSGAGVGAIVGPEFLGQSTVDSLFTPAMDYLNPHPLRASWWDRFLHSGRNRFGYWLHWGITGLFSNIFTNLWRYDENERLRSLKPPFLDRIIYWQNAPLLAVSGPELIKKIRAGDGISIHRAEIVKLSGRTIHLHDGSSLQTDALVYATGYSIHHPIFSQKDSFELGLPVRISQIPTIAPDASWPTQDMLDADKEVLERFPRLRDPPIQPKSPEWTQYWLYRFIVPFPLLQRNDRSLAFVGYLGGGTLSLVADVSALWAVAWLSGRLEIKRPYEEMVQECDLLNAFLKRRCINASQAVPYMPFEGLTLMKQMLDELGLEPPNLGVWRPHFPKAYKGITETWLAKNAEYTQRQ